MANKEGKYALISVYDKSGIVDLAKNLIGSGYNLIVTEGTGRELGKHNLPFISAWEISKNPGCFDGFLKTLSFSIEGGIIFDRENTQHLKEAKTYEVLDIDVVVCNFFPVSAVLEKFKGSDTKELVRYFDFGGPIMVKTAAQNYKNVLVLVDPNDYALVNQDFAHDIGLKEQMAIKAFRHIHNYDQDIVDFFESNKKV